MKVRADVITREPRRIVTADDFALPETLGNPPKEIRKALDRCFSPVSNILSHSLDGIADDGIPSFLGYGVLTGLAQNGLIRAGVCMRADEMTRKWGEFVNEGAADDTDDKNDTITKLESECRKFKLQDVFHDACEYCGFFGGCLVFIDTGEEPEEWATPLILSEVTFRQKSLKRFKIIEPYVVTPGPYNSVNPMADDYYKPTLWYVQGIPVHASRLLYFAENELPTWLKPAYNFFGLPLAQKVLDAVSHYTADRESASRLLKKYSLTVFKTDMSDVLNGGFGQELQRRIDFFVQNRDNDGVAVIDKDREDLVVMTTSLAGVTDLVRQSMEYVAAMFNEPVVKMWGLSPAGFNTGESDMRSHYDNIESLQQKMFGTNMERVCKILQMNAFGTIDSNIQFKFAPLSEDDKTAMVTNNKTKAETAQILMEAGVIAPEEVRQNLIDDPDSGYDSLEPYVGPIPTSDPLEPFNPELDPDDEEERKEVTVV